MAAAPTKPARRPCRWVRFCTNDLSDGPELIGAKACTLQTLTRKGVAVPPFFIITREACAEYLQSGSTLPAGLLEQIEEGVTWLQKATPVQNRPLLLAVRKSAAAAIPGLMPAILSIPLDGSMSQLRQAIEQMMRSWDNPFAVAHRRMRKSTQLSGLAVIVQAMVIGEAGRVSTRDATTGRAAPTRSQPLRRAAAQVERACGDAQEFSFIVEHGKLWILNSRPADRTATAAVRIAVDLARERIIDRKTAILRVDPASLEKVLHPALRPSDQTPLLATGTAASPGAAVGRIAFSADEAQDRARRGERIILVRVETDATDVIGMHACEGILTSSGGLTSHAAVVARGIGKPCITGATALAIDVKRKMVRANGQRLGEGDFVSIDGANGHVYAGQAPIVRPTPGRELLTLLTWADQSRHLGVRANADTPEDARLARRLGAEGIGLCRTEHMFFAPQRIHLMRQMILAADGPAREKALARLLPYQRQDFIGIFKAMNGLPVTIRLLDPPLHEFLPRDPREQKALADDLGLSLAQVQHRVQQLREANPMLGHRGCRLLVSYPEILVMQVRAIIEAACVCQERGIKVHPEIMIPLVIDAAELRYLAGIVQATAKAVMAKADARVDYQLGSMIETPRAALLADEIAAEAEFFSFGTNDLTQMTLGLSRDDANTFLPDYLIRQILDRDPFATIDQPGVGMLMHSAFTKARSTRPTVKCGICGEHGGDPRSIDFCHRIGLDYVSCSPYRLPIARLAAAHAALRGS